MGQEYRVSWRREERGRATRIYQTEAAARRKADGILATDEWVRRGEVREEFADMPPLVEPPLIQVREVGEWEPAAVQVIEPSEDAIEGLRSFVAPPPYDDYSGIF